MSKQMNRREVGKMALAGALGAMLLDTPHASAALVRAQPPGIKLGSAAPADPTDEDLLFFRQLGVDCVYCAVTPETSGVESLLKIKKRYADAGLTVHNIRNLGVTNNQVGIVLNRPDRDKRIEAYKSWLRALGQAGFHYTLSTFNLAQVVSSGMADARGSQTRDCDLSSSRLGIPGENPVPTASKGPASALLFGREYSVDEIWANYTHFIREVAPVAEEAQIAIGFHPDDPPMASLWGVPRIFSTFENCKKALAIANSPNVGMCLCAGTWAEGGAAMGIDPEGAIRHFGARKQIYEIHYRNVSAPLPHFHETFMDNGYYDMYKVMKALADVKYDGIVQLDHFVPMVGGNRAYEAFSMGYMRAMRQRALAGNAA